MACNPQSVTGVKYHKHVIFWRQRAQKHLFGGAAPVYPHGQLSAMYFQLAQLLASIFERVLYSSLFILFAASLKMRAHQAQWGGLFAIFHYLPKL